jgi:hypothetical protein
MDRAQIKRTLWILVGFFPGDDVQASHCGMAAAEDELAGVWDQVKLK